MLPKNWDDVFYLMRKDILAEKTLPDFSIAEITSIHKLFWVMLKEEMKDESMQITLPKFLKIVPKKDANGNHFEKRKITVSTEYDSVGQTKKE
jgi:hypothetical protein